MYVLTMDTDFAPDFVVDHAVRAIHEHGLQATVFCTGAYQPPVDGFETALHPNFMADSTQGKTPREALANLKRQLPHAVGSRSHRLYWHSGLKSLLAEFDIRYDATPFMPLQPCLQPVDEPGMLRFPFWWSDVLHLRRGMPAGRFSVPEQGQGLRILNFHPIHIYLNTADLKAYRESMAAVDLVNADPETLAPHRRPGPGVEAVFLSALDHISKNQGGAPLLKELAREHVEL